MSDNKNWTADDVIGFPLSIKRETNAYRLPNEKSDVLFKFKAGQETDPVYSYVGGTGGKPIYWMLHTKDGQTYYIKHTPGGVSETELKKSGATTQAMRTEERRKEEEREYSRSFIGVAYKIALLLLAGVIVWGIATVAKEAQK